MSAALFFIEAEMNLPHLDEKMELATSPYPLADDIDLDLEPVRQQSIDRSMADDAETAGNNTDPMQADAEDMFEDDDMLDDDTIQQPHVNDLEDLNMESYEGESYNQDDEILYDEEEGDEADMDPVDVNEHINQEQVEQITQNDTAQSHVDANEEAIGEEDFEAHQSANTNSTLDWNQTNNDHQISPLDTDSKQQPMTQQTTAAEIDVLDFAVQDTSNEREDTTSANQTALNTDDSNAGTTDSTIESQKVDITTQSQAALTNFDIEASTTDNNIQNEVSTEHDTENFVDTSDAQHVPENSTETLHPVTIVYLDQEMSLFPPMVDDSSATFFVSDTSLAYEPIDKLLASCREVLGETLEHDDELVIDIPALGLHICEDSKYASQITLSQVLDVYLTLLRNEDNTDFAPLYCDLSSRVCLASQYAYLAASAAEGKAYADIAADYIDSPDDGAESYQDETEDAIADTEEHPTNTEIEEESENTTVDSSQTQQTQPEHQNVENSESMGQEIDISGSTGEVSGVSHSNTETDGIPAEAEAIDSETHTTRGENYQAFDGKSEKEDAAQSMSTSQKRDQKDTLNDAEQANVDYIHHQAVNNDDAESVSSHTVEGDNTEELSEETRLAADAVIESTAQILSTQDHTIHDDPEFFDIGDEYLDEHEVGEQDITESFDEDGLESSANNHNDALDGEPHKDVKANSNEEIDYTSLGLDDIDDQDDVFSGPDQAEADDNNITINAPVTPSKTTGTKRKASDEDEELDFLDLSTPEPKRTRSS